MATIHVLRRDPGATDDATIGFGNGDLALNMTDGKIWVFDRGAWSLFGTVVSPLIATADPTIAGEIFSDTGVVTISAGA